MDFDPPSEEIYGAWLRDHQALTYVSPREQTLPFSAVVRRILECQGVCSFPCPLCSDSVLQRRSVTDAPPTAGASHCEGRVALSGARRCRRPCTTAAADPPHCGPPRPPLPSTSLPFRRHMGWRSASATVMAHRTARGLTLLFLDFFFWQGQGELNGSLKLLGPSGCRRVV